MTTELGTIMMPQALDTCIREMCSDAMTQATKLLAEKYGFDVEEANRFLESSELKIARKRGPVAATKKDSPKGKGKDKADKADKPKRGKTGYLLYADEVRAEVRSALTSELKEGEKLKPQDVVRAIAAQWKEEDDEVKEAFKARAKTPQGSSDESE